MLAEYMSAPIARDVIRFIGMEAPSPTVQSDPVPPDLGDSAVQEITTAPEIPPSAVETEVVVPRKLIRVAFTADEDFYKEILRAQQLMRHKYPNGRLEGIFRDALKLLIEEKDLGLRAAKAAARKARRYAAKMETAGHRDDKD